MVISGIICEYNPFHLGHEAHIAATRERLGAEAAVICVMSGNFVQRGEPAIVSKHARAEMALCCGADLVLENPAPWALGSAERFALGGVGVLAALGLPVTLSFGSECGDIEALRRTADILCGEGVLNEAKLGLKAGISFAAAREAAVRALSPEAAELLRRPNNILAVEYLKAIRALGAENIEAVTVRRVLTEHDGAESGGLAPASRLREILREGGSIGEFVPEAAMEILRREISSGAAPGDPKAIETAALWRLRTMTEAEWAALPDATEGLWRRMAEAGKTAASLEEFYSEVKTKRYALSRLRRMTAAAMLGITAEMQAAQPPYIRVLGANEKGRSLLHEAKKQAEKPIITKPAAIKLLPPEAQKVFETEARATDLFALTTPASRQGAKEWQTSPVMK